jgi:hypothetical protein
MEKKQSRLSIKKTQASAQGKNVEKGGKVISVHIS